MVWYDRPENALADMPTFLAHLMGYGSPNDLAVVEQFVPEEEFGKVRENAAAGISRLIFGAAGMSESECPSCHCRVAAFLMVQ